MDVYPMRLLPGTEIKSYLQAFVERNKLQAAFILTCCGSVTKARLRFASDQHLDHKTVTVDEKMEITSLVGTICKDGAHLHTTLGNQNGQTVSGHVVGDFIVHTTAEIVLGNAVGYDFSRKFDENTGFAELVVESKKTDE
ncbi:bifunctional protein GlmU-like [Planococcus citri]|uniref:bifunctional protein GlmU-like n=1 Tax=Planococcus citri TaxID=170843 RepID=UPI0031FA0F76